MIELPMPLVDASWLSQHLVHEDLVVLDASVPPVVPGFVALNAEGDFKSIPGARRFDYDKKICKPDSSLPHMMPSAELFTEEVRKLGINRDSLVVVYDDVGIYASPRAWWMLKAMGHDRVAVLNGGLPAWLEAGNEISSELDSTTYAGNFEAREEESFFCDFNVVLEALDDANSCIVDARSAGRFNGTAPEPRPGVRGGHMPSAKNLPCRDVLADCYLKPEEELRQIFSNLASPEKLIITSCGSGITACILTLAANVAGFDKLAVYDGSWAEWGAPSHLPVLTDS